VLQRYLETQIISDLAKKMVFLSGPRQVGKTTVAKSILGRGIGYLNWDIPEDREIILRGEFPPADLLVFDELHKYSQWRNLLKGLYDHFERSKRILVTGSARLDYFRYSGDSLQGRYHHLRLHPLSVAELGIQNQSDFQDLLNLGAFPEPFFSGSETEARRWSREYRNLLIREEMRDLQQVLDLGKVELLALRLPDLVGSPLSINAIREDLHVSHKTAEHWVSTLERLYAISRISPFGAPKIRAITKARKHYHFDWSVVADPPRRFENLVAMHLLKWTHYVQDTEGRDVELRYFRDVDGREVDFVVVERMKPLTFIEVKWADSTVSKGLRYLKRRFPEADAFQISAVGVKDYETSDGYRVLPAYKYLSGLV